MGVALNRRSLILGSAAAGGSAALLPFAARAAETGAVAGLFGPAPGEAQLSRNENPYGPAPSAITAIGEAASRGCYYADKGLARLTQMIAERHSVSPRQVVIGSGSTEILSAVALAWGSKGKILCPGLFWDTTVKYSEAKGAEAVRVPLAADMSIDLDAMAARLDGGVSLVQICNPNNPTGMLLAPSALKAFAAITRGKATLLVDEAYNELTDDPESNSLVDMVRAGEDVIVCRTFSKIYGMAGMRVGYAITSEANAVRIEGYLMSFGGNVGGLAGAIASYNDKEFLGSSLQAIQEARGMINDAVAGAGIAALPSQANFVFVRVPDANAVQKAMAERNITIRGAYGSWTEWSRVSTGKLEDVQRYARALPEVIDSLFG